MGSFFVVRRVRVRPQYAWLYLEIAPGVWIRSSKAAWWVKQTDPNHCPELSSDRTRPMCDAHEFRGGDALSSARDRERF
jgi:hypothetical protein